MKKKILIVFLKYGLGLILIAYMVWKNWDKLEEHFVWERLHVAPILIAGFLTAFSLLLTVFRWFLLVRAQNLPFTFFNAVRLGLVGFFFSTFLPGSVGGDIVKAAFIAREQKRRTVAISTVLVDRVVGLWALAWLVALLGGAFWAAGYLRELHAAGRLNDDARSVLQSIILVSSVIVAVSLAAWLVLGLLPDARAERFAGRLTRLPKVGRQAAECWRALWLYHREGTTFWLALLLSLANHVSLVFLFYASALAFQETWDSIPPLVAHFLIIPIGLCVMAFSFTPGGLGVGEAAFGGLYFWIGYPFDNGFVAALVYRAVMWALGVVGYVVYLNMRPALAAATEKLETEPAAA